jgi:hypothetical protein
MCFECGLRYSIVSYEKYVNMSPKSVALYQYYMCRSMGVDTAYPVADVTTRFEKQDKAAHIQDGIQDWEGFHSQIAARYSDPDSVLFGAPLLSERVRVPSPDGAAAVAP